MRGLACWLLVLAPLTSLGDVPESIIGTWRLDLPRTVEQLIDQHPRPSAEAPATDSTRAADGSSVVLAPAYQDHATELADPSNTTMTITEATISTTSRDMATVTVPYRVIGGNSRLVMIETQDDAGNESVVNIRLVEDGLAIESTNCREKPEQCRREREQRMRQHSKQDPFTSPQSDSVLQSDGNTVVAGSLAEPELDPAHAHPLQPAWVYFKRVDEK